MHVRGIAWCGCRACTMCLLGSLLQTIPHAHSNSFYGMAYDGDGRLVTGCSSSIKRANSVRVRVWDTFHWVRWGLACIVVLLRDDDEAVEEQLYDGEWPIQDVCSAWLCCELAGVPMLWLADVQW